MCRENPAHSPRSLHTPLLLLDEPTAALDILHQEQTRAHAYARQGRLWWRSFTTSMLRPLILTGWCFLPATEAVFILKTDVPLPLCH